ncbi:MAG: hypothetical protein NC429_03390 [Lachnospiraceae bacterium]|nr:hypothetical protein [Lachnospiraceae bacterium]
MLKWHKKKKTLWDILWLTIIYVAAHWFLLVATGKWWDDWVYADHNVEHLIEVCMQSGLPLDAFINMSVWNLPYRWLVFLYSYLDGVIIYFILKKIDLFSAESYFWVSALFVTIPINNERIIWICYSYSFCFLLFFISFYLVTFWIGTKGFKRIGLRILSLLILLVSFNMESNLLMTLLILFYMYYTELKKDWKWKEITINIKKVLKTVIHYIDFLIAPVAWYILDKLLFPGYGLYAGRSDIPWSRLLGIVIRSPMYAFGTLKVIAKNYSETATGNIAKTFVIVGLIVYIITIIVISKKEGKKEQNTKISFAKNASMIFLGVLFFYIGFFPYGVKRDSSLRVSRDFILLGIGTSILIYYSVQALFREKIYKIILVFIVMLGVTYFNLTYFDYQESYYQQLQLRDEIAENVGIRDNNTFLVIPRNAVPMLVPKFYEINGNAWAATGEETRMFISGVGELRVLYEINEDSETLNECGLKDYDCTDKEIDGIILADYKDIDRGTMLRQKWNELFNGEAFHEWIRSIKNIRYVSISSEESERIWKKYEAGELTDDFIYEWYG